jgi:hypothetical protein
VKKNEGKDCNNLLKKKLMLFQLVNFLFVLKLSSDFYQGSNIYISIAVARTDTTREITHAVKTYNCLIKSGMCLILFINI